MKERPVDAFPNRVQPRKTHTHPPASILLPPRLGKGDSGLLTPSLAKPPGTWWGRGYPCLSRGSHEVEDTQLHQPRRSPSMSPPAHGPRHVQHLQQLALLPPLSGIPRGSR